MASGAIGGGILPGSSATTTASTTSPPSAAPRSPPRADTRYIPLQLTHLARNLKYHDNGMLDSHDICSNENVVHFATASDSHLTSTNIHSQVVLKQNMGNKMFPNGENAQTLRIILYKDGNSLNVMHFLAVRESFESHILYKSQRRLLFKLLSNWKIDFDYCSAIVPSFLNCGHSRTSRRNTIDNPGGNEE